MRQIWDNPRWRLAFLVGLVLAIGAGAWAASDDPAWMGGAVLGLKITKAVAAVTVVLLRRLARKRGASL